MQLVMARVVSAVGVVSRGTRSDSNRGIVNPRLTPMLSLKRIVATMRFKSNGACPSGHLLFATARVCGCLATGFFLF